MTTVIFDIDGTLANCKHRLHHVRGRKKNWPAFFAGIPDDPPYPDIVRLAMDMEFCGYSIVCATGRSEDQRSVTEAQLQLFGVPYERLYMRASQDFRPDHVVKAELLDQILEDGFKPWLVIDDRQSVVDMWRSRGLTVLQCEPDEPHTFPETAVLTLLVGPSGAGKSTWVQNEGFTLDIRENTVISSDQTRQDLCGDFRNQGVNEQVYQAIHAVVKARLRHGLPTCVDATNIRRKDRVQLATLCPVRVRYVIIDRPLEDKLASGGWRLEVKVGGMGLIEKHHEVFQSNLKDILKGDDLENVEVIDMRSGGSNAKAPSEGDTVSGSGE
jgi:predicted kinase